MTLLISFLIGIQVLHSVAASSLLPFLYPSCNSLVVKAAAEVALDKLNADQTEGYVLALQRVFYVSEIPERLGGSRFYLTLDVLETNCHVLTRKPWKECKIRDMHETVYGQCKLIIHFKRNSDRSRLHFYKCALGPISSWAIVDHCLDCPLPGNPSEAIFQQTALETLAKFNAENEHNHYFRLVKVTRANSQWFMVEYTIQETSCSKNPPVSDITRCPFLPDEIAIKGLCKGSVMINEAEKRKNITVNCDFFPRPPPVTDEQEPNPTSGLILASQGQEARPQSAKPAESVIPPFPKGFSQSDQCPGDILVHVPGLELPSLPQAETS